MSTQSRFLTIPSAKEYSGLGTTSLYLAAGRGELTMVKAGRRTLVDRESLEAFLASLPRATIRTGQNAA